MGHTMTRAYPPDYDPAMRLRGFSGSDPTFLAISISLAMTYEFGSRPWEYVDLLDLSLIHLVAIVVAGLLIRPRSRLAWIAGALTALLTWHHFPPHPYRPDEAWLFAIPRWIDRRSNYGNGPTMPFLIFFLLYAGPMVMVTAAVRPDLSVAARAARIASAVLAASFLWVLAWNLLPLRLPLNPYWLRYHQIAAYLLPSVVTPLLVWRLMLARRPELPWLGAAVLTPLASIAVCAPWGLRGWAFVSKYPVDCVLLTAFALAGPVWAYRDWSSHRRNAQTHGFDVILTSSSTPQQ